MIFPKKPIHPSQTGIVPALFQDAGGDLPAWAPDVLKWIGGALAAPFIYFSRLGYKRLRKRLRNKKDREALVDAVCKDLGTIKENLEKTLPAILAEQKYQRARLDVRDAVDIIPQLRTDASGRFIDVNEAFCRLFDRTRDELLGHGWRKIIARDELERIVREWSDSIGSVTPETIEIEYRGEFLANLAKGEALVVLSARPVLNTEGAVEWLGSIHAAGLFPG